MSFPIKHRHTANLTGLTSTLARVRIARRPDDLDYVQEFNSDVYDSSGLLAYPLTLVLHLA
jgi:hypothetical protein